MNEEDMINWKIMREFVTISINCHSEINEEEKNILLKTMVYFIV